MNKILLIFIALLLLCGIVSATINVSVDEKSTTDIKWSWNTGLTLTNLSVDGYQVILADLRDNRFVLSDCQPNETHIIKVYTATDSGTLTTTTLSEATKNTESLAGFFYDYIWWTIAICILIGAVYTKSQMLGYISAVSTLIGIVRGITDHSFIVFFLYIITFISAYLVTESLKE